MPQFSGPTYRLPNLQPERQIPRSSSPLLLEHNQVRVWAFSRWRSPRDLIEFFLEAGFRHLSPGGPPMYQIEEQYEGELVVGYYVTFTNRHDAEQLRYTAFWYGCEYLAFTDYGVFTNFNEIFRFRGTIHGVHYAE